MREGSRNIAHRALPHGRASAPRVFTNSLQTAYFILMSPGLRSFCQPSLAGELCELKRNNPYHTNERWTFVQSSCKLRMVSRSCASGKLNKSPRRLMAPLPSSSAIRTVKNDGSSSRWRTISLREHNSRPPGGPDSLETTGFTALSGASQIIFGKTRTFHPTTEFELKSWNEKICWWLCVGRDRHRFRACTTPIFWRKNSWLIRLSVYS